MSRGAGGWGHGIAPNGLPFMVLERFGDHIVKADGVSPWADERFVVYEVLPGGPWVESLTTVTWPG